MDPPSLMNESSFPSANGPPYNLSEIWQVPINGGAGSGVGGRLELHRPPFVPDLSHFAGEAAVAANRDVSGSDVLGGVSGAGCSARKRRDAAKEEAVARGVSTSGANAMNDNINKRLKTLGSGGEDQHSEDDDEKNTGKGTAQGSKLQPEPPKDYIHVRARRGQATDSHSLAERARREKISDRMKTLQDLVPGCNKVIGKAMVLDEIINYVQSLQQQVEFLSMKLEAVNSRPNVGLEGYHHPLKNFGQQLGFDPSGGAYGPQAPEEDARGSSPEWLHMQVGSGFER